VCAGRFSVAKSIEPAQPSDSAPPLALQLWSVRDEAKADFPGTLKRLAGLGFAAVEYAGWNDHPVSRHLAWLKETGLRCAGLHVGRERLRQDSARVLGEALEIGAPMVICPWWPPEELKTEQACALAGEELGRWAQSFREKGVRFGFHNHGHEVAEVAGKRILNRFLEVAGPDLEIQLDVYWAKVGGVDPVGYLRELGSRIGSLHLKDQKELGGGPVDLAAVVRAGRGLNHLVAWVVEQEEFSGTVWDGIAASARYAKNLLSS